MDIAYVLHTLIPSAKYFGSLTENTREAYDKLEWHDERPKPSWAGMLEAGCEVAKEQKKSELAEARWIQETSGVTLPNGTKIATDDRSQTKLNGIVLNAMNNPEYTLDWKGVNGWVTLGRVEVMQIGAYVSAYIQSLFDKEKALTALVDSCKTVEEVASISWDMK